MAIYVNGHFYCYGEVTGTGACVQDCCDLLGHCKIKACPCGGSGGSIARSFGVGSSLARR